jgi:hypothetical protein
MVRRVFEESVMQWMYDVVLPLMLLAMFAIALLSWKEDEDDEE